jgi:hypothetical protein
LKPNGGEFLLDLTGAFLRYRAPKFGYLAHTAFLKIFCGFSRSLDTGFFVTFYGILTALFNVFRKNIIL